MLARAAHGVPMDSSGVGGAR
eukprot:SAG22_NODE_6604_length_832_cov_1.000000_1_plen_20_part_10